MKKVFFLLALPLLLGCNQQQKKLKVTNTGIPAEHVNPTADQKERRFRSEAYCTAHGVPLYANQNSFFSDPESLVNIRQQDSVADRALALSYIGLKSEGLSRQALDAMDKTYTIMANLSPKELEYATAEQPTEQQRINATWRYEGLHVMLWALGYVDSLGYPGKMCDVAADLKIIKALNGAQFRQKAKLRSKKEILDMSDRILRLDWACVDARVNGKTAPGGLNPEVVVEWHHALNWLIRYGEDAWDDVTTDT